MQLPVLGRARSRAGSSWQYAVDGPHGDGCPAEGWQQLERWKGCGRGWMDVVVEVLCRCRSPAEHKAAQSGSKCDVGYCRVFVNPFLQSVHCMFRRLKDRYASCSKMLQSSSRHHDLYSRELRLLQTHSVDAAKSETSCAA